MTKFVLRFLLTEKIRKFVVCPELSLSGFGH